MPRQSDPLVREPEGDELAPYYVASEDDLVPVGGMAAVLHPDVVLVGVEVRDPVIRDRVVRHRVVAVSGAEHVARRDRPLMQRVCPVIDPQPSEQRMAGVGDIAGGEDALLLGLEVLVREQAVVDHDLRVLGQSGARGRADPRDNEVAIDHPPVGGAHTLDPIVSLECFDAGAQEHLDAVVGVDSR